MEHWKLLKNNKGVTVVELIVTIVLTVIVLFTIWLMFSTSMSIYDKTAQKVDAQSQFRLFMDVLEKEIGYAKAVDLYDIDPETPPDPASDYYYIYIKEGTKQNTVYRVSNGESPKAFSPPAPLPGFEMELAPDPANPSKLVRVTLRATGTVDYQGSILLQNTTINEVGSSYNSFYYTEY